MQERLKPELDYYSISLDDLFKAYNIDPESGTEILFKQNH